MSELRDHLANILAKKIEAHGIVVWVDPEQEYASVAEAVCPSIAQFVRWNKSWYRLRYELEQYVSGATPPRVLIYQPTPTPNEDPLAEVRNAGTEFRRRLATLVREGLSGLLTHTRLEELAQQGRTFSEIESALTSGEGTGVRLPAVLKTADKFQLTLRILADPSDDAISLGGLWDEARSVFARTFGGESGGDGDTFRIRAFRHLLLTELHDVLGKLPAELARGLGKTTAEQRHAARELMTMWRRDRQRLQSYRQFALQAQDDLDLRKHVRWAEALTILDSFPALEELAFDEFVRFAEGERFSEALRLAHSRLAGNASIWLVGDLLERGSWAPKWTAAAALAQLRVALSESFLPKQTSCSGWLHWYADQGWRVDRAHRRMEWALTEVYAYGALEEPVRKTREAYESWLEQLMERFTAAVEVHGLDTGDMLRQGNIHHDLVQDSEEPIAYIAVDALRYELGEELARALESVASTVKVLPAVSAAPSLTPVGMANLLPGAESGLALRVDTKDDLHVIVAGIEVKGVPDRVKLLRASHGQVEDILLTEIFDQGEEDLRKRIGSARLIYVRSQEIDQALETDQTAAGWRYITELKSLITRAVARLGQAGVHRVIIASDHGFVILSRALGPERIITPPGGKANLHRRCWVGKGGATTRSMVRVPLAEVGISGDLDLIVPRGLGVFGVGGARRFFHGGLSPQELLIPVLEVHSRVKEEPGKPKLGLQIAGNRISTGVFSAVLEFQPDLFTQELVVRIRPIDKRTGFEIARVITGEGYNEETGSLTIGSTRPNIVTFRVVADLKKGDRVVLEARDAKSDRILKQSKEAEVVSNVIVGDELG